MARTRMIILFDQAKKLDALVCGTENKSEHLLGYFTRFGDAASDIEPIQHLYKTQIYQLAKYLKIPREIINQPPTAGLWNGQTDEGQFEFTYKEADQVLSLYYDQRKSLKMIIKSGFPNVKIIIKMMRNNQFKNKTPYII
ncbi:NAD(+) synthase [Candidatus Roizmanbacteria bacterium]|nr:NAD(+) synthase [Candidatus Roizmanbacteria bacterium]